MTVPGARTRGERHEIITQEMEPQPSPFESLFGRVAEAWNAPVPYAQVRGRLPDERFVEVQGLQLYVEQAGQGEPVLLLHGFCCSSFTWREVIPGLARDHRVIAPDLPGFGYTERPRDPQAYRFAGLGRTVLGLLDRLEVAQAHLIGHSYGGALALWFAERHPERVRSLSLVSTATPDRLAVEQRQAWARYRPLNYLLLHAALLGRAAVRKSLEESYHDPSLVTDELVDAYRDRLLVEGIEDAYYGFLAPVADPPPPVDLQALEMPVLMLWGDDDRIIPAERATPYVTRFPRVRMVVFDGCGHVPMEERPRAFLAEVLPFLRRHRQPWRERVRGAIRDLASRLARRAPAAPEVAAAEAPSRLRAAPPPLLPYWRG